MPRGDKSKYTDKQERKADHIAESYQDRGVSDKEAERRAWATVNKDDGGGKKAGGSDDQALCDHRQHEIRPCRRTSCQVGLQRSGQAPVLAMKNWIPAAAHSLSCAGVPELTPMAPTT